MLNQIKVKCTSSFMVHDIEGLIFEGEFLENEEYVANLDKESKEFYIESSEGCEWPVAHYDIDDLILEEGFELVNL